MPSTIIVNFLTTQHKASMGMASGFPDVCKTPAPPAPSPVPIPYPNIGMSSMASSKVSKKVKNNGQKVMVKGSAYTMTSGDEAGVMFGIISNRIKGKSEILNCSFDVKYEGKGVGRLTDPHGNNCGSKTNCPVVGEVQGPDAAISKPEMDKACEALKQNHVTDEDLDEALEKCGMDKDHAKSISDACQMNPPSSVTFRATNKSCGTHIKNGFLPKGSDVKNKTISKKNAIHFTDSQAAKVKEHGLEGMVGVYTKNGRLKGVKTDKGMVPISKIPPPPTGDGMSHVKNGLPEYGRPYSGDYDAHDMFGKGGARINDGTPAEKAFQERLNTKIGRGADGNMVQHGPQNNYTQNCANKNPPETPICKLQLPDVSPDEPLLAFDESGDVFVLETEEDLRNYYKCKGQEVPPEWDGEERERIEQCAKDQKHKQDKLIYCRQSADKDDVWELGKDASGRVRDLQTGRYMSKTKPWDRGHITPYDQSVRQAAREGVPYDVWRKQQKDPKGYRPELPSSNRNRKSDGPMPDIDFDPYKKGTRFE